jgi:hypothetical protein
MKSRDDARKEKERQKKVEEKGGQVDEKDKKGLYRKALAHNLGGGFFSGKKSFSEHFNYKMPPKPNPSSKSSGSGGGGTRSSGGTGAGLAKILTGGFGSLVADTTAIQGGLTAITQLLNSQLQSSSFTSNGISGIQAILADQLEAQGEMIELMGGERPSGGSGASGSSGMFGMSGSVKTGGKTLTEAMINAAIEKGIGRFITSRLSRLNPFKPKTDVPKGPSGPKGYYDDAAKTSRANARNINAQQGLGGQLRNIGDSIKGKTSDAIGWGKGKVQGIADFGSGLLGKAKGVGEGLVNNPITRRLGAAGAKFGGRMLPVAGTGFSAAEAVDRAKKGDAVGAWLAGLGGAAGGTATVTSAAALTGAGAVVPAAAEGTSMVADLGLLGWDIINAFNPMSKMSSGGVMIGEAGKESVVDLNSSTADAAISKESEDPGIKASGGSMLAVVDQFVKGMGPLGAPVAQALGPDVQNLARQFGMSQVLPNLKIGGAKFKDDGKSKREKNKFLETLISGSLEALGAKKKDTGAGAQTDTPAPTGDANAGRSQERQEDTKQTLENIPGAGAAMERPDPKGINKAEGEQAMMTTEKVKGTQVALGTGDKLTVPSADLNPVVGSNGKYWYDNKGQIYKWRPGEQVVQMYLDEIQKQGKADSFDLVRDMSSGVVRRVSTQKDWNPFNNANVIKNGEYSYRANDKLVDNRNATPVWSRQTEKQDLGGLHGPEIAIPKQSSLTSFEDGGWFQRLTRWMTTPMGQGASDKAVSSLQRSASAGNMGSTAQGLSNRRAATDAAIKEMLGHEKGGSMFGMTQVNKITIEQRVDEIEKMTKMLASVVGVSTSGSVGSPTKSASPPKSVPSSPAPTATNQVADGMSEMAVINVIQSGGSSPTIQKPQGSTQNTAEYASDPTCNGLASVLCLSSPWGSM